MSKRKMKMRASDATLQYRKIQTSGASAFEPVSLKASSVFQHRRTADVSMLVYHVFPSEYSGGTCAGMYRKHYSCRFLNIGLPVSSKFTPFLTERGNLIGRAAGRSTTGALRHLCTHCIMRSNYY